jgi:solute carrier family 8 (sodium/calcium exchanger)
MCAIEVITSQTKTVKVERNGNIEEVQVKVWNYTIANLSLMALGSSAPEILLSVIEIVGNDFKSGDLGPSTIVGSAAFNLLVITAICMMSIPHGESRRIKSIKVFGVTSFFSVFAYVWLYIVLQVSSSDEVELWEALITLFLFVALLLLAYVVDKEFCKKKIQPARTTPSGEINVNAEIAHLMKNDISVEEASTVALQRIAGEKPKSRLWYRVNAIRNTLGGRRLIPRSHTSMSGNTQGTDRELAVYPSEVHKTDLEAVVQFTAEKYSVYEKEKKITITIVRYGRMDIPAIVKLRTMDGTAKAGEDYCTVEEQVTICQDQHYQTIDIPIINDDVAEEDEVFFIRLSDPGQDTKLGSITVAEVLIIDDDSKCGLV